MSYQEYLARKLVSVPPCGLDTKLADYQMFPHQNDLASWAVRRGRSAIFADTGLGKSRMQIAWADTVLRKTGKDVLILAPLAVAEQTIEEGRSIDVLINHVREGSDVRRGINITNYERLHKINPSHFGAVVLDESSIIKHHSSKTLKMLLDAFRNTPYKLCATATPAPNDWTELGTHAEFLGICTQSEMLAEFFIHDAAKTQDWRLKKHAKHLFWKWVSSWAALVRSPQDLGHDGSAYELPPLKVEQHTVESGDPLPGHLFYTEAQTLMERRDARKQSLDKRVRACADMVNSDIQPWVVWCDLNAEGDALKAAIPGAVEIRGSDDMDAKEERLRDFAKGGIRVLITKPSIAGFGLNWQHCSRMAFVGVTDSFEAYYQAVRRCWRFGQKKEVQVHIFASEQEGSIIKNLQRKEAEARVMADSLSAETLESVRANILGSARTVNEYDASKTIQLPSFVRAA